MKKYFKYIMLTLIAAFVLQSCEDSDATVDFVFDNTERGAILKTIEVISGTFVFTDTSSEWGVLVEYRDNEDNALLDEVEVFITYIGADGASNEALANVIPGSDFAPGEPYDNLQAVVSTSYQQALDALGLSQDNVQDSDQFFIRLNLKLNDGRNFTNNASGNVSGGSFFSSPFQYSAQFFCVLTDASLFSGDYVVVVDTWADYAAGDIVPVVEDPDDPLSFRILASNNPFIANGDTAYMLCTINPADGSITVKSNEPFDYGVDIDVTGSGGVGTCTGDININPLTFVGYGNYVFNLVKK